MLQAHCGIGGGGEEKLLVYRVKLALPHPMSVITEADQRVL